MQGPFERLKADQSRSVVVDGHCFRTDEAFPRDRHRGAAVPAPVGTALHTAKAISAVLGRGGIVHTMQPTPAELEFFRKRVEEVPFLRLLDIKLEHLADGEAEMSMVIADKHLQTMGIVHGGVIASLLDSVTWWAALAAQKPGDAVRLISTDLKLNYLSALKSGKVTAKARCKKAGSRVCYAVGEIHDEAGRLAADGSSTLLVLRSDAP